MVTLKLRCGNGKSNDNGDVNSDGNAEGDGDDVATCDDVAYSYLVDPSTTNVLTN